MMQPGLAAALGAFGGLRLAELALDRRNQRWLRTAGAQAVRPDGMAGIVGVHVAWFAGCASEGAASPWAGTGPWTPVGATMVLAGLALRGWSMAALGRRWSTRVFLLPRPPVRSGPYRWLRHPIYAGVSLELVGVPLAFGLWVTIAALLPFHAWALRRRVAVEASAIAGMAQAKAL